MFEKLKKWNLKHMHNIRAGNVYYAYVRWSNYPIRDYHELYLSNEVLPREEGKFNEIRVKLGLEPVQMLNAQWYIKGSDNRIGKLLFYNWKDIFI